MLFYMIAVTILLNYFVLISSLVPSSQIDGLYYFYNSTGGESWNWNYNLPIWNFSLPQEDPCANQWQGVICRCVSSNCNIAGLILPSYSLCGSIPEEINLIPFLAVLNISKNAITGVIPDSLGDLLYLQAFDSSKSNITGNIPDSIGNLRSLQYFNCEFCRLNGSIPTSFSSLTNLVYLYLGNNMLTGQIEMLPLNFNLSLVDVNANAFTGSLPCDLFNLNKIVYVDVSQNMLSGMIIFSCVTSFRPIQLLHLGSNRFTGLFPDISLFSGLQSLRLWDNSISGPLPSTIGNLAQLGELWAFKNMLNETFPTSLGQLQKLQALYLFNNSFSGSIIAEFALLTSLQALDIAYNSLTGSVPTALATLTNIVFLGVTSNLLTGDLQFMCMFPSLSSIGSASNLFTGSLPTCMGDLFLMQQFLADHNMITGSIPDTVSKFIKIQYFSVLDNKLTGTVPAGLAVSKLRALVLSSNHLSGVLPSALSNVFLYTLSVSDNLLHGHLGNVLKGNLTQFIQIIDLSNNLFSGSLPASMFDASYLTKFTGAQNCFTGSISPDICKLGNIQAMLLSGLGSNDFCPDRIAISNKIYFSGVISGVFPACIFNSASLIEFYADGNGINSVIPDVPEHSNLQALSLSHNRLHGSIPDSLLKRASSLRVFDLSYNRIGGTVSNLAEYSCTNCQSKGSLKLLTNRLSGVAPSWMLYKTANLSVNVLEGNLFTCKTFPKSTVPIADSNHEIYSCGSYKLNSFMYFYSVMFALLLLLFSIGLAPHLGFVTVKFRAKLRQFYRVAMPYLFWQSSSYSHMMAGTVELHSLAGDLAKFRRYSCWITVFSMFVCLPVYVILKTVNGGAFATHTYQYGWFPSIAFVDGGPSNYCVSFVCIVLLSLIIYIVVNIDFRQRLLQRAKKGNAFTNVFLTLFAKMSYNFYKKRLEIAVLGVNFLVVAVVNGAYVYCMLTQNTTVNIISIILMSLFKLCWNNLLYVIMEKIRLSSKTLLFAMIFNIITGPVLATMAVDVSCFQSFFTPASHIDIGITVGQCVQEIVIEGVSVCFNYVTEDFDISFIPPFTYSFQCGSVLLQYYVPVFVLMYTITGLVVPICKYLVLVYFLFIPNINERVEYLRAANDNARYRKWYWLKKRVWYLEYVTGGIISNMVLPLDLEVDLPEQIENVNHRDIIFSMLHEPELIPSSPSAFGKETNSRPLSKLRILEKDTSTLDRDTVVSSGQLMETNKAVRCIYYIKDVCLNLSVAFAVLITFGVFYPLLACIVLVYILNSTLLLQVCLHYHYEQILASGDKALMGSWAYLLGYECYDARAILFKYIIVFTLFCGFLVCLFLIDIEQGFVSACVFLFLTLLCNVLMYYRLRRSVKGGVSDVIEIEMSEVMR